jgi:HEAT repeats
MRHIIPGGLLSLILFPGFTLGQPVPPPVMEKKTETKTAPQTKADGPSDPVADDQKLLRGLGLGIDGPALLDYFKKRTFPEADAKEMAALIKQLGDEEFVVREKAYDRLMTLGVGALVGIKEAAKSKDAEVSRRADDILHHIESKADPAVQIATTRLIALGKPAGAGQVLLNYLPFAADSQVTDEICKALAAVAVVNGKADPVVVKSLTDKIPVKRGAAGEALARAKVGDELPTVRKLLKDPDPSVRLRVGLALVPLKEKEVLPVLVDCLAYLNPDQLWPVEEILVKLAGEKSPSISLGSTEETRKACRDAWQAWLDKEGKTIDLAKLEEAQTMLGYTLVVALNRKVNAVGGVNRVVQTAEVMELDASKKPRWKFEMQNNVYPVDGQVVRVNGADRVLLAEYQGGRVSERDFKGEVKWEKAVGGNPIGVQRLPNGNTFVIMQNRLLEIDRDGNEKFNLVRPSNDIMRARKLLNGDVAMVTSNGMFTRMEGKTQKTTLTFHVGPVGAIFGSMDVLPDGGVLLPDLQQSRVVEYNAAGKEVKSIAVQWQPNSVMRLPNGNTLISSQNTKKIAEYDRNGQLMWSHEIEGNPLNVRRR